MAEYMLTASSTVDLTNDYLASIRVPYICFHYELGGESHPDDLWQTMDPHTFYQRMLDGEDSRTSQINMTEYMEFWRPFLREDRWRLFLLRLSAFVPWQCCSFLQPLNPCQGILS